MKKLMLLVTMLSLGTLGWAGSAREDATERLENATNVLHEIMGMPDKGIPEEVLEHAKCVAVVPHMIKGGFVFGGKGGKGVATCRTANGWSAPAFITISGGNWGLQIGVEAVDLVMIIQNEKGMQKLLSSNFHVGADASAAAGPVGRHAEAGTNWKMDTEILTYSRAKGVFAGLTLEGASIRQDSDSRHAIYGRKVTTKALLLGKVPAPASSQPFLTAIRGAKSQAVAQGRADDKSEARAEAHDRAEAKDRYNNNVTLTGCLQKNREGVFAITERDGKTWELRSAIVELDNHLGHTVTVTGPRAHETKAQEKAQTTGEAVVQASSKEVYPELRVTSLKMVSESCQ
jgi:SH3 domain-containing YSC84-like protein 1